MANDFTSAPLLWVLDTAGACRPGVHYIKKILFIPDALGDDVLFNTWDENTNITAGSLTGKTGAISSNSILTSTGNLPSDIKDGDIFKITVSSGAAENLDSHVVETAGDDDAVTVHHEDDSWTNEDPVVYSWETYYAYPAIVMKAGASDASPVQLQFSPVLRIENLSLETLDGGTLYVYHARTQHD